MTSHTSRLAPPSSQKSRNRVVNARGRARGAGATTAAGRGGASATATEVMLTDGLPCKTRECLARAVPSAAANFGCLEIDFDAINDLRAAPDLTGHQIDTLGDLLNMLVDRGVVAAVRKEIDQHRNRQRLVEDRVLRVHVRAPRQRVARDDRHELTADQIDNLRQQFRMLQLVAVKSLHE